MMAITYAQLSDRSKLLVDENISKGLVSTLTKLKKQGKDIHDIKEWLDSTGKEKANEGGTSLESKDSVAEHAPTPNPSYRALSAVYAALGGVTPNGRKVRVSDMRDYVLGEIDNLKLLCQGLREIISKLEYDNNAHVETIEKLKKSKSEVIKTGKHFQEHTEELLEENQSLRAELQQALDDIESFTESSKLDADIRANLEKHISEQTEEIAQLQNLLEVQEDYVKGIVDANVGYSETTDALLDEIATLKLHQTLNEEKMSDYEVYKDALKWAYESVILEDRSCLSAEEMAKAIIKENYSLSDRIFDLKYRLELLELNPNFAKKISTLIKSDVQDDDMGEALSKLYAYTEESEEVRARYRDSLNEICEYLGIPTKGTVESKFKAVKRYIKAKEMAALGLVPENTVGVDIGGDPTVTGNDNRCNCPAVTGTSETHNGGTSGYTTEETKVVHVGQYRYIFKITY